MSIVFAVSSHLTLPPRTLSYTGSQWVTKSAIIIINIVLQMVVEEEECLYYSLAMVALKTAPGKAFASSNNTVLNVLRDGETVVERMKPLARLGEEYR